MFRSLVMLGAGWFIYTKTGRKTAVNICKNCVPLLEKELGIKIIEPIKELTKDPDVKAPKEAENVRLDKS